MKSSCVPLLAVGLLVSLSAAQNPPSAPIARTDVYHVHFAKAAIGKGAEEGDFLKQPDPIGTYAWTLYRPAPSEWRGLGLRGR
jgi:hypothetical protein